MGVSDDKDSNKSSEWNRSKNDAVDEIYRDVDDLKRSLSSIAKSVFNLTNHSVTELNEKAKTYYDNWPAFDKEAEKHVEDLLDSIFKDRDITRKSIERPAEKAPNLEVSAQDYSEKPAPYTSFSEIKDHFRNHWGNNHWGGSSDKEQVEPFFGNARFGMAPWGSEFPSEFFRGSRGGGKTPFGYYSAESPSIRNYNDCVTKNGESVWDTKGYWRCLFPNSEVPVEYLKYKNEALPNKILTKEDLAKAVAAKGVDKSSGTLDLGEQGVYFKKFEDYLNWKNIMYENVKKERRQRKEKLYQSRGNSGKEIAKPDASSRDVISSSSHSSYSTNSESNEVQLNEIRTDYFKDGSSITKTITKSKPLDAKDWVNVSENVEHGKSPKESGSGSGGWFWNSKGN